MGKSIKMAPKIMKNKKTKKEKTAIKKKAIKVAKSKLKKSSDESKKMRGPTSSRGFISGRQVRVPKPLSIETGSSLTHDTAPRHDQASGMKGHRLKVSFCPGMVWRDNTTANQWFLMSNGSTKAKFLTVNPTYEDATNGIYSIWGLNSAPLPAQAIARLYTKYAVRAFRARYIPTGGLLETGSFVIAYRQDADTVVNSFTIASNTEGAMPCTFNAPGTFELMKTEQLSKPASKLYYVDSKQTSVVPPPADLFPALLTAVPDVLDASGKSMGQLWFDVVIDLYQMVGSTASIPLMQRLTIETTDTKGRPLIRELVTEAKSVFPPYESKEAKIVVREEVSAEAREKQKAEIAAVKDKLRSFALTGSTTTNTAKDDWVHLNGVSPTPPNSRQ